MSERQSRTIVQHHLSACLKLQHACGCIRRWLASRENAKQGSCRHSTVLSSLHYLWLQLEETRQREDIHKAKQDRDAMLAGKAANIARIRRIAHAQAAVRRHQAQERQAARAAQVSRVKASLDEQASLQHTVPVCSATWVAAVIGQCAGTRPRRRRQPGRPGSPVCRAVQVCL